MTTAPLEPHPEPEEEIPAADAGVGAPPPSEGFGVEGEEPDQDEERNCSATKRTTSGRSADARLACRNPGTRRRIKHLIGGSHARYGQSSADLLRQHCFLRRRDRDCSVHA